MQDFMLFTRKNVVVLRIGMCILLEFSLQEDAKFHKFHGRRWVFTRV